MRAFLSNFQYLEMTREVAERAAVIRRQKRLKMPDAIILATAEAVGGSLLRGMLRIFRVGLVGSRCLTRFEVDCEENCSRIARMPTLATMRPVAKMGRPDFWLNVSGRASNVLSVVILCCAAEEKVAEGCR